MSAWSGKTQESSLAAATGMGNDMVSFQIPYQVTINPEGPKAYGVVRRRDWVPMGREP